MRALLVGSLFVSLAAFACAPEPPASEGGSSPAPRQSGAVVGAGRAAGSDSSPEAPSGGRTGRADASTDANALGAFFPVFPGVSSDTHSTECDPFEDSSEICL